MPITRTAINDDDGSGTTGTVIDNAWKQELYNQIDAFAAAGAGAWTNIPFNAANYAASSGAWTLTAAEQTTLAYLVLGTAVGKRIVFVTFNIGGTQTIAVQSTYLLLTLPPLPGAFATTNGTMNFFQAATKGCGSVEVLVAGNQLRLIKDIGGTPWTTGAGALYLNGTFWYPA